MLRAIGQTGLGSTKPVWPQALKVRHKTAGQLLQSECHTLLASQKPDKGHKPGTSPQETGKLHCPAHTAEDTVATYHSTRKFVRLDGGKPSRTNRQDFPTQASPKDRLSYDPSVITHQLANLRVTLLINLHVIMGRQRRAETPAKCYCTP